MKLIAKHAITLESGKRVVHAPVEQRPQVAAQYCCKKALLHFPKSRCWLQVNSPGGWISAQDAFAAPRQASQQIQKQPKIEATLDRQDASANSVSIALIAFKSGSRDDNALIVKGRRQKLQ